MLAPRRYFLALEDNPIESGIICQLMFGYRVVGFVASSFEDAAEIARLTRIDAITIDLDLGSGVNGLEIAKRLEVAMPKNHLPPERFVISGRSMSKEDECQYKELNIRGVFQKPITPEGICAICSAIG